MKGAAHTPGPWRAVGTEDAWQVVAEADALVVEIPVGWTSEEPAYPCGHPRNEANSVAHGNGRACRTCRREIVRKSQARSRAKQRELTNGK